VRFIDPAWGFAMGWNYAMNWLVVLPFELTTAGITIGLCSFEHYPKASWMSN
jgi:amino acid permease